MNPSDANTLDHDIRLLLADALTPESRPLTAFEVVERGTEIRLGSTPVYRPSRSKIWVAAGLTAAALLLGSLFIGRRSEITPAVSIDAPGVGQYFLPTSLPDGYELLNAEEIVAPGLGSPARSIYTRAQPSARVALEATHMPADYAYQPHGEPFPLDEGTGSWQWVNGPVGERGVQFEVFRDGVLFGGQAIGIPVQADEIADLISHISVDEIGIPVISSASGFIQVVASVAIPPTMAAVYGLTYGIPGNGNERLYINARRKPAGFDERLEQGIFAANRTIDGKNVWTRGDSAIAWMPDATLEISAFGQGSGYTAIDMFRSFRAVGEDEFAAAIGRIAEGRPADEHWSVTLAGRSVVIEQVGSGDSYWLCLREASQPRRCALTEQVHDERDQVHSIASFLSGGRWYIVQGPGEPEHAEARDRATTSDNRWDVELIDDNAQSVTGFWQLWRPIR